MPEALRLRVDAVWQALSAACTLLPFVAAVAVPKSQPLLAAAAAAASSVAPRASLREPPCTWTPLGLSSTQKPGPEKSSYTAEDVTLHEYGDTIVVAFRLEGRTELRGKVERTHFRNTGVFLLRDGRWQAVAWQATKMDGA